MEIAVFSTQPYDEAYLQQANKSFKYHLVFFKQTLTASTVALAAGFPTVCIFVNDRLDATVLAEISRTGTKLIALRAAGFNNVDLKAAEAHGITVVRVPAYSPYAVAEYTVGLLLALDRKICRAWVRVREDNFTLDGLVGRDLHGKVVGVIGTGRIGSLVAKAFKLGFGCTVLATDVYHDPKVQQMGVSYVELNDLIRRADVICLHCPLTSQTRHLINAETIALAKPGFLLINTGRGALINTEAVVNALKSGHMGGLAMDVYEEESDLFFKDLSNEVIKDDVFQHLLTFPNVIVTGHQAFFTQEALAAIAQTTLQNVTNFEEGNVDPATVIKAAAVTVSCK